MREKNYELFVTENAPNGTNDLVIVCDGEVKAVLDEALFGATTRIGLASGVYAETAGGYAGQIHGATYIGYDGEIWTECNLNPYEADAEELEGCPEREDWSMIDYMDNMAENGEITKLYWIDEHRIEEYVASSPVHDGLERVKEFLLENVDIETLEDLFEYGDKLNFDAPDNIIKYPA